MRTKVKQITRKGNKNFLTRFNIYRKKYSIKIHFFKMSDPQGLHDHPWNFKSLLLLPYKEEIRENGVVKLLKHKMFSIVNREATQKHRVLLYKIFGIEIPALTIGKYSSKIRNWEYED